MLFDYSSYQMLTKLTIKANIEYDFCQRIICKNLSSQDMRQNRYVLGTILTLAVMLSITPSVSAQNIPDLLDAGTTGTTPDSFAYGFKRLFEALDLAFTFNENDKVVKHIKFAELRFSEAISVVLKGMPEFVDGLTRDYDKQISDANKIAGLAENANDRETLSELVVVITSKHLEVLDKIKDIVPEQAKEKISSLKEIAIKGSTEALKNLAQENPKNL